jgi:hypothetical protein
MKVAVLLAGGAVFLLILLGLGILLTSAAQAPQGYENGDGFHVGAEPDAPP